ncbi:MAG TPA: hypothetical protein VMM15_38125 [Bradyrhizobium sp.]|nr:hypothetical protein [Bradyrhizobium sp.]
MSTADQATAVFASPSRHGRAISVPVMVAIRRAQLIARSAEKLLDDKI